MKKLICLFVAAAVLLAAPGFAAFAAGTAAYNGAKPFADYAPVDPVTGEITLTLNSAAISKSGAPDLADYQAFAAQLQLNVATPTSLPMPVPAFDTVFTKTFAAVQQETGVAVVLKLTPKDIWAPALLDYKLSITQGSVTTALNMETILKGTLQKNPVRTSGGTALVPTAAVSATMAKGQTIDFIVPNDNLTGSSLSLAGSLSLLNGSYKNQIRVSGGYDSYFDKEFIKNPDTLSPHQLGVRLTAKGNGVIPAGTGVSLGGNTACQLPAIVMYNSETPYIIALKNSALSRVDQNGASLLLGQSIELLVTPDNFNWSPGANPKTLLVSDVTGLLYDGAYFSASVLQDAGNVRLYLTAIAEGTIPSAQTGFSRDGATASLMLPQLTITKQVGASRITGIASGASLDDNAYKNGVPLSADEDAGSLRVNPGDYIDLHFDSDFFTWRDGNPRPVVGVSKSMLSNADFDVKFAKRSGGDVIRRVELDFGASGAFIRVYFVEDYAKIADRKFEINVYFTIGGRRQSDSQATLKGTFRNPTAEVYSGDDIDMSDGAVVTAMENISKVTAYIGHNMYLHTRFFKDRSYYAKVSGEISDEDYDILSRNSDIAYVYTVEWENIQSGAKVSFDTGTRYYIYDSNGSYLGTPSHTLPLLEKYYLSYRQIDFSYVFPTEPDPAPPPEVPIEEPPVQQPPVIEAPGGNPPTSSSAGGSGSSVTSYSPNAKLPASTGGGSELADHWYYVPGWNENFNPPTCR